MGGRGAYSASALSGAAAYEKYIGDPVPFAQVSRKQAGMIFSAYKRGDLDATKQQMNLLYTRYAADRTLLPTTDASAINVASSLRTTVNALASGDSKAANAAFRSFLDNHYRTYKDSNFPDDRRKR